MSNQIGKRGESIFSTIISRNVASRGFLFDPTFLGDKFPTLDFHVGLLGYPLKGFFYASVKTTTLGYYPDGKKLRINIGKEEITQLVKFTIPVYVFGIDELEEKGCLISANDLDIHKNFNGLETKYPVNDHNIARLWDEVAQYWDNSQKLPKFISNFTTNGK